VELERHGRTQPRFAGLEGRAIRRAARFRSASLRRGIVVIGFVFVRLAGRLNGLFIVGQVKRSALPASGQGEHDQGRQDESRQEPKGALFVHSIPLLGACPGLIHYTA
jgi:hypothetical protein